LTGREHMTKALFDFGNQGTCPNLFGGQFMDFDEQFYADCNEGFAAEPTSWVSVEETASPVFITDEIDDDRYYDYIFSGRTETEEHFYQMADEIGLDARRLNVYDKDGQQEIIAAWVEYTYGEYCQTGGAQAGTGNKFQTPTCFGQNRSNHGAKSWYELSEQECKTWAGNRRGKGLKRAPKWQLFAGGRRKGRQSIRFASFEDKSQHVAEEFLKDHS